MVVRLRFSAIFGIVWFLASFLKAAELPVDGPIHIKPGALTTKNFATHVRKWAANNLESPFEKRAVGKNWETDSKRFVAKALDAWVKDEVEPAIDEIAALDQQGCDDPLVLWLAGWSYSRAGKIRAGRPYLERAVAASESGVSHALNSCVLRSLRENYKTTNRIVTELEEKLIDALGQAVDEGSFEGEGSAVLVHLQIDRTTPFRELKTGDRMATVYKKERISEWARETLLGHHWLKRGWRVRGGGWAFTVRPEKWVGFEEHIKAARKSLIRGWELQPNRPEAASEMIAATMSGFADPADSIRLWFDRSIAAQCDYQPAFDAVLWASRPRWGGTHEQMIGFGKACAKTARFDTGVPAVYFQAIDDVASELEDWRPALREPSLAKDSITLAQGLIDHATEATERAAWQSVLPIVAFISGDFPAVTRALKSSPVPINRGTIRKMKNYGIDASMMAAEASLRPRAGIDFDKVEAARRLGDFTTALGLIEKLRVGLPPHDRRFLDSWAAAARFESNYAEGGWVSLMPNADLSGWHQVGCEWSVEPDGTLVCRGTDERARLIFEGRLAGDFEMRGEFSANSADTVYRGFGFIFAYSDFPCGAGAASWARVQVMQAGATPDMLAHVSARNGDSEDEGNLKVEVREWNRCEIRFAKGRLTWRMNGNEVLSENKIDLPHLGGHPGFGMAYSRDGNTTRYRNIEVRRIGGSPQKRVEAR